MMLLPLGELDADPVALEEPAELDPLMLPLAEVDEPTLDDALPLEEPAEPEELDAPLVALDWLLPLVADPLIELVEITVLFPSEVEMTMLVAPELDALELGVLVTPELDELDTWDDELDAWDDELEIWDDELEGVGVGVEVGGKSEAWWWS